MKHEKITLRQARKSDIPGICDLFRRVFGGDRDAAYWEWKYFRNPHGAGLVFLAVAESTVVGLYGLIPRHAQVNGVHCRALQEVDLMIDPAHTRGGLFRKMGRAAYAAARADGYDFTFGFPNQTSLPAGRRILKWRAIEEIPLFTRMVDPARVIRRKWPGLPAWTATAASVPIGWYQSARYRSDRPVQVTDDPPKIPDAFAGQWAAGADIRFIRDAEYMAWRYRDHFQGNYRFLTTADSSGLSGFAVLKTESGADAHLAEFMVRPDDAGSARSLVAAAVDIAAAAHCEVLRAWALKDSRRARLLRETGFIPRDSRIFHTIRSFRSPEFNRVLWDPRRWVVSSGDSDCV